MAEGWATNKKQQKRYFDPSTGAMYKGFKKIGSDTYYFYSKSGVMATGWVTNSKKGYKYYSYPQTLEQFHVSDERTAAQVTAALKGVGIEPVWKDWDQSFDEIACKHASL